MALREGLTSTPLVWHLTAASTLRPRHEDPGPSDHDTGAPGPLDHSEGALDPAARTGTSQGEPRPILNSPDATHIGSRPWSPEHPALAAPLGAGHRTLASFRSFLIIFLNQCLLLFTQRSADLFCEEADGPSPGLLGFCPDYSPGR